jgi:hypothetical protein
VFVGGHGYVNAIYIQIVLFLRHSDEHVYKTEIKDFIMVSLRMGTPSNIDARQGEIPLELSFDIYCVPCSVLTQHQIWESSM